MNGRGLVALVGFVCVSGCPGASPPLYVGERMDQYFVFDGDRSWEFISADTELPYLLNAKLIDNEEVSNDGTRRLYTIRYNKSCQREEDCEDGEFVRSLDLSFDSVYGAELHGYKLADQDDVLYDPPVLITEPYVNQEDVFTSEAGGTTWTSSFLGFVECPHATNANWPSCAYFDIDDGGLGSPFAGEYWVNVGYNIVAFDIAHDPAPCGDMECSDGQPAVFDLTTGAWDCGDADELELGSPACWETLTAEF